MMRTDMSVIHFNIMKNVERQLFSSFDKWIEFAFKCAELEYKGIRNNTKSNHGVSIRRCVFALTHERWKGFKSLAAIGLQIAIAEGKTTPYAHSTVLFNVKSHNENMENYKLGYQDYFKKFNQIKSQMKNAGYFDRY